MHTQSPIPLLTASYDGADLLERLSATVAEVAEYVREHEGVELSGEQQLLERVRRLLAGGTASSAELGYELDALHLGVIARGSGAAALVEDLAEGCERKLLLVPAGEEVVCGWLGGQRRPAPGEIECVLVARGDWGGVSLAIGEPGRGLDGWRQTHRQAQMALSVALCGPPGLTRFADVAVLAPMVVNRALGGWLVESFLAPLDHDEEGPRSDGAVLRETLRAYVAAGRRSKSAAHALGVNPRTVANRLRTVEQRLGRLLDTCLPQLEVALQVEALSAISGTAERPRSIPRAAR
jgi:PucR C-terminal helix-turn-helix domain/GGDEF-like domain